MKKCIILIIVLLICFSLASCKEDNNDAQVVATTQPVYVFATLLCQGTDIRTQLLITENVSCLHDYTLQVTQMQSLESADIVVISGAGLEVFLDDILTDASTVVDASEGVALFCPRNSEDDHEESHDHEHEFDPHIWLSPVNAKTMASNICNGLINAYPAYADQFRENLSELNAKFDELIMYADTQLATLSSNELITFHDGFQYMADAFGLKIIHAIEEESGSEASAAELIGIINVINGHQVKVIFTESNGSCSAASIIANETGVSIYQLDMGMGSLDYFDAMYHNIDTLKEALQ